MIYHFALAFRLSKSVVVFCENIYSSPLPACVKHVLYSVATLKIISYELSLLICHFTKRWLADSLESLIQKSAKFIHNFTPL